MMMVIIIICFELSRKSWKNDDKKVKFDHPDKKNVKIGRKIYGDIRGPVVNQIPTVTDLKSSLSVK